MLPVMLTGRVQIPAGFQLPSHLTYFDRLHLAGLDQGVSNFNEMLSANLKVSTYAGAKAEHTFPYDRGESLLDL